MWNVIYQPFEFVRADYNITEWGHIAFVVVLGTLAPFGLYFVGINYIRSTRAMITATLEPMASCIIAYFYLGEKVTLLQGVGAAIMIAAIMLLQLYQEKDPLAPAVIRQQR